MKDSFVILFVFFLFDFWDFSILGFLNAYEIILIFPWIVSDSYGFHIPHYRM